MLSRDRRSRVVASCCTDGAARKGAARASGMGRAALLWGCFLLGCSWGAGPPGVGAAVLSTATYVLDDAGGLGREFDGIGAISGGGVSGAGGRGGSSGAVLLITSPGRHLRRTLGREMPSVGAFGGFGASPRGFGGAWAGA